MSKNVASGGVPGGGSGARGRNGLIEVVLLDDDVRPDRIEKLALGDQLTGPRDSVAHEASSEELSTFHSLNKAPSGPPDRSSPLDKTTLGRCRTMKTSSSRISAFLAVGLAASLVGCAGEPLLSNWRSNSRQLPFDAVLVGPGERVTVDALPTQESKYFCSNGAVLQCERFGLKLDCSCPRVP